MSTDAINSKLDGITDWDQRGRQAHYCVRELAAFCGVAAWDLEHYFRRTRGFCPRCWLHALRVRDAQRLLLEERRIKEVAFELAYKDYTSFSRAFRRAMGCCPRAFIRQIRAGRRHLSTPATLSQNAMSSGLTVGDPAWIRESKTYRIGQRQLLVATDDN